MDSSDGDGGIWVSFPHIRDAETELVGLNSGDASQPKHRLDREGHPEVEKDNHHRTDGDSYRKGAPKYQVLVSYMVAVGMQFGSSYPSSPLTSSHHQALHMAVVLPPTTTTGSGVNPVAMAQIWAG